MRGTCPHLSVFMLFCGFARVSPFLYTIRGNKILRSNGLRGGIPEAETGGSTAEKKRQPGPRYLLNGSPFSSKPHALFLLYRLSL